MLTNKSMKITAFAPEQSYDTSQLPQDKFSHKSYVAPFLVEKCPYWNRLKGQCHEIFDFLVFS
jgi:hypothetical protein